jgi:hypothetical protein
MKTMNLNKRKREVLRIDSENLKLVKKLSNISSLVGGGVGGTPE